jgi:hypothetical protein
MQLMPRSSSSQKLPNAIPLYAAVLSLGVGAAAILFVPNGPAEAVAAWTAGLVTSVVLLIVSASTMIAPNGVRLSGTFLLSILNIAAVIVPSASLVWRSRVATVERLLGVAIATPEALTRSLLLFTATIAAFAAGEFISARLRHRRGAGTGGSSIGAKRAKSTATVLLAIGLATYTYNVAQGIGASFVTRGEAEGQGLLSMAAWALPVAIAVSVANSHWGSRTRVALSLFGLVLIVLMGVRSPLILIALAFVPRAFQLLRRSRYPLAIVAIAVIGANALIAVGTGINVWRGGIRRGNGSSLPDAIMAAWLDPFGALSSAGLDTIDGALFVHALPPGSVSTGPGDLLNAILYLIPRQIYPGKPELLSNILSERYLNFGTAGMFLSGAGYLELILGGVVPAVLGFFVMGLIFGGIVPRVGTSVPWLIAAYVLVRFYMGGDAYDFFLGLQLALVWLFGSLLSGLFRLFNTRLSPARRAAAGSAHRADTELVRFETPDRRLIARGNGGATSAQVTQIGGHVGR